MKLDAGLPDEELIDRLQHAAFDYFGLHTNPANGLVADNSSNGAPCSIAAVGFALTALPAGVERGWISRNAALDNALTAARFFSAEQRSKEPDSISHHGFFFHFLDMQSGRRAWRSEISSIDSAILALGLLIAASYFDGTSAAERELNDLANDIVDRLDWGWMDDPQKRIRMGWKPEAGFLKPRWTAYSEALLMFALGLPDTSDPLHPGSYGEWRNGFEWSGEPDAGYVQAGPLFIHLFAHAWFDMRGVTTGWNGLDYVENSRRAIEAQRAYAVQNPNRFKGYDADVWGLSACPGPARMCRLVDGSRRWIPGYLARAVPFGPDDGTLVPWAALSCLPLTPDAAMSGVRAVIDHYPNALMEGRFIDAFNPSIRTRAGNGWYSGRCTALDQGLVVAMVENARTGLVWKLAEKSDVLRRGLELIRSTSAQTMPSAAL